MPADEEGSPELELLVERLRALANPVRVRILQALVIPKRAAEIRVRAAGERAGLGAERLLGRSTVIEHLALLEDTGLVRRLGEHYAIDQQGMVALLQDLGDLARLRALVEVDVEVTRASPAPAARALPDLPRVLIANGPEAGRAVALGGPGPWRFGRGGECEIPLSHDPHVSRLHATLSRAGSGYEIGVEARAKNPVLVDFSPLPPGATAPLRPGAMLTVGATLLVLQA